MYDASLFKAVKNNSGKILDYDMTASATLFHGSGKYKQTQLSDHCPVSLDFDLNPLTNTVPQKLVSQFKTSDTPKPNWDEYYLDIDSSSSEELRVSLNQTLRQSKRLRYSEVWKILDETEKDPSNNNNVILIYSRDSVPSKNKARLSNQNKSDYWNREHIWPQSSGLKKTAGKTDVHNIFASDRTINSSRGNKLFNNGGSQHHECEKCTTTADTWQPPADVKGDIARALFYMDVRYEGGDSSGTDNLSLTNKKTNTISFGILDTLKQWHCEDPVSPYELRRNDIVFKHQQNRNPFIDHPEWAGKVFNFSCQN
jgi:endonuclease I